MIAVNQPVIEAQAPRPSKENLKTIYLAGGCFWGMQSYFDGVQGVVETTVGYANSTRPNPNMKMWIPIMPRQFVSSTMPRWSL